jgi:hypothetical protein
MSINWDEAPKGATHYNEYNAMFYCLLDGIYYFYGDDNVELLVGGSPRVYSDDAFTARPAKQWSGPQDGLPSVNTECEVETDYGVWELCTVLAHGYDDFKPHAVAQCASGLWMEEVNGFRAINTPEQLAAEQRETAIREIMDIADVDCRVTAARLVDAGFKREVV